MSALNLKPVKSSNIAALGYDPEAKALTVQFKSGALHRYADVPPETHAEMLDAESIGKYFHANVRSAFKSSPVDPEEQES